MDQKQARTTALPAKAQPGTHGAAAVFWHGRYLHHAAVLREDSAVWQRLSDARAFHNRKQDVSGKSDRKAVFKVPA